MKEIDFENEGKAAFKRLADAGWKIEEDDNFIVLYNSNEEKVLTINPYNYWFTGKVGNFKSNKNDLEEDAIKIISFISKNTDNIENIAISNNQDNHLVLVDLNNKSLDCNDISYKIITPNDIDNKIVDDKSKTSKEYVSFVGNDNKDFVTAPVSTPIVEKENGNIEVILNKALQEDKKKDNALNTTILEDEKISLETETKLVEEKPVYANGVPFNVNSNTKDTEVERIVSNQIVTHYINPKNRMIDLSFDGLLELNKSLYQFYDGVGEIRDFKLPVDESFKILGKEDIEIKSQELFKVYSTDKDLNVSYTSIKDVLNDKSFLEDKKRVLNLLASFMYNGHKLAPFKNGNSASINIMAMQIAECCGFKLDLQSLEKMNSKTASNKIEELSQLFIQSNKDEWELNVLETSNSNEKLSTTSFNNSKKTLEEIKADREELNKKLKAVQDKRKKIVEENKSVSDKEQKAKANKEIYALNKEIHQIRDEVKKTFAYERYEKTLQKKIDEMRMVSNFAAKDEKEGKQHFNKITRILNLALEPISLEQTNKARANSKLEKLDELTSYQFGNDIIRLSQIRKGIPFDEVEPKLIMSKIERKDGSMRGFRFGKTEEEFFGFDDKNLTVYSDDELVIGSNFPVVILDQKRAEQPIIPTSEEDISQSIEKIKNEIQDKKKRLEELQNEISNKNSDDANELPPEVIEYQKRELENEIKKSEQALETLEQQRQIVIKEVKDANEVKSDSINLREHIISNDDGTITRKSLLTDTLLRVEHDYNGTKPYDYKVEYQYATEQIDPKELNYNANAFIKKIENYEKPKNLITQKLSWNDYNSKDLKYSLQFDFDSKGNKKLVASEGIIFEPNLDKQWDYFKDLAATIELGYFREPVNIPAPPLSDEKNGKLFTVWDAEINGRVLLQSNAGKFNEKIANQDFKSYKNKNLKFIMDTLNSLVDKAFIEYVPKIQTNPYDKLQPKMDSLCIIRDVELTMAGKVNAIVEKGKEFYVVNDLLNSPPDFNKCVKTEARTLNGARVLNGDNENSFKRFVKRHQDITTRKEQVFEINFVTQNQPEPLKMFKEVARFPLSNQKVLE